MVDYDSNLPVRTRSPIANMDVIVGICDATTTSQQLAVSTAGRIGVTLRDASTDANSAAVDASGRLSVKTATAGDVIAKIVDTGGVNELSVDASGMIPVKLNDSAGSAWTLGQKVMASSMPVVIASDQSTLPILVTGQPIDVNVVSSTPSNVVHDYNTAAAVAAGGSNTHTYTNNTGSTVHLEKVFASASGAMKVEVKIGPAASEVTKAVAFTTSAHPWVHIDFPNELEVPNGERVLVIRTNRDKAAMDVYSFINGYY